MRGWPCMVLVFDAQRQKSTFFAIFSSFRVHFGDPPLKKKIKKPLRQTDGFFPRCVTDRVHTQNRIFG